MKCGVVILNYNNYNLTKDCVNSLLSLNTQLFIVIVDNNSPNNSYEKLKNEYKENSLIEVIKTKENKGYSNGNNYGIKYIIEQKSNIEYLAIINPDVIIKDKNIFIDIIEKMNQNEEIALMGAIMILNGKVNYDAGWWNIPNEKQLILDHAKFLKKRKQDKNSKYKQNNIAIVDVVPGSFFIIKKKALIEINYLDEDTFLYNEENILAIKLLSKGYKEAISLDNFYLHNHNPSAKTKTLKQKIKINKISYDSRKILCKKYYNKKYLNFYLLIIHLFNLYYILLRHFIGTILKSIQLIKYREGILDKK